MIKELLKDRKLILASGSPRRQQFFVDLGLDFTVEVKSIEEVYPPELKAKDICEYLAQLKAKPFLADIQEKQIVVTSDTIVWHENKALGKPKSFHEAYQMLRSLSGKTHEVITAVCFTTPHGQKTVSHSTKVTFKALSDNEINYYISNFKPYDKAGGYGIQEWIGYIGVTKIEGSYFNVMGMPMHLVYEALNSLV